MASQLIFCILLVSNIVGMQHQCTGIYCITFMDFKKIYIKWKFMTSCTIPITDNLVSFATEYTEVSGGNSTRKSVAHLVNTKETTAPQRSCTLNLARKAIALFTVLREAIVAFLLKGNSLRHFSFTSS